MIPSAGGFLKQDFEVITQPSKTYRLKEDAVSGVTDGGEALRQAIEKIIRTERYCYPIYSWNYGMELQDLYGQPVSYVCPELERRIAEALIWDDRITEVTDFEYEVNGKKICVKFTAHTVYGPVRSGMEVKI